MLGFICRTVDEDDAVSCKPKLLLFGVFLLHADKKSSTLIMWKWKNRLQNKDLGIGIQLSNELLSTTDFFLLKQKHIEWWWRCSPVSHTKPPFFGCSSSSEQGHDLIFHNLLQLGTWCSLQNGWCCCPQSNMKIVAPQSASADDDKNFFSTERRWQ